MIDPEPYIVGAGPNGELLEDGELPPGVEPAQGADQE